MYLGIQPLSVLVVCKWAPQHTEHTEVEAAPVSIERFNCNPQLIIVNRPPSASNRGLAVGPIGAGTRGTAIIGGTGMVDPAASRGAFSLNIHGTNGKLSQNTNLNKPR